MLLRYFLLQDSLGIFLGFSRMYRQRILKSNRVSKLPSEYVLLDIVVVMIVKTHLSPTDAARVSHCFRSNFGKYRGPSVCGGKDSHVGLDLVSIQFCAFNSVFYSDLGRHSYPLHRPPSPVQYYQRELRLERELGLEALKAF